MTQTCTSFPPENSGSQYPATADSGSTYAGWAGCDSVTGSECEMSCPIGGGRRNNVTATFNAPPQTLAVALTPSPVSGTAPLTTTLSADVSGTAVGTINYSFWWNCTSTSTSVATVSDPSVCNALPAPPLGSCASNAVGYKCNAVNNDPQPAVHAYAAAGTYTPKVIAERGTAPPAERRTTVTVSVATFALNVTKLGTGTGTVTSVPVGINCGLDCNEIYTSGTSVTLSAAPAAGSSFVGWSGDADCSDGSVTMTVARNCIATFNTVVVCVNNCTVSEQQCLDATHYQVCTDPDGPGPLCSDWSPGPPGNLCGASQLCRVTSDPATNGRCQNLPSWQEIPPTGFFRPFFSALIAPLFMGF